MYPISRSSRALHGAFRVVAVVVAVALLSALAGRASAYTIKTDWDGAGQNPVTLKYYYANATSHMVPADDQRYQLVKAMNLWAKYADITWVRTFTAGEYQSIDFGFYTGNHGDGWNFDGAGGTLAHSFYPPPYGSEPRAGDVHFDEDEMWSNGTSSSTPNLYSVALHEIGHALGMDHSTDTMSVMYGTFYGGAYGIGLCADDIAAIRSIYAPKYPVLTAEISGTHPWRSDLEIIIGVKADHSSSTPLLEKVVFNQAGGGNANFNFSEVDLIDFRPYMDGSNDFYLKIIDHEYQNQGTLQCFTMKIDDVTYGSSSMNLTINDAPNAFTGGVTYVWIDNIPPAVVPEPATLGMLGLGAVWMAWGHARRKSRRLRVC